MSLPSYSACAHTELIIRRIWSAHFHIRRENVAVSNLTRNWFPDGGKREKKQAENGTGWPNLAVYSLSLSFFVSRPAQLFNNDPTVTRRVADKHKSFQLKSPFWPKNGKRCIINKITTRSP